MTTSPALHWIDGEWVDSGTYHDSFDPATGKVIGQYAEGSTEIAAQAIAAAKRAFDETSWKDDRQLRARVLLETADAFARSTDELVETLALENGKLKQHARFEVEMVPSKLRFAASVVRTDYGRALEVAPGVFSMVLSQARGVAGIIVPWNSPVVLLIRSLAPALAAGCTTVVKMPSQTAQTNSLVYRILSEVESLPRGVINAFTEQHSEGARLLVASPDVPCISFTGSTGVGKAISASGAEHLKRFGLELGGKTPMIVFDDADLDAAVPALVNSLVVFNGQFCMTGSRLLVQSGIAGELRRRLIAHIEALRVGPAADPASELGPVIDKPNMERIDKTVEEAIAAGAEPLVRGGPVLDGPLAAGSFYRASLLEVADNSLDIVQEETFGPVMTLQVFDTEAEAVALANDNKYGLAASIWTRDIDRPLRVARDVQAGTIWINDWAKIYDEFEEGGVKDSGLGRMNGIAVMDDFLEYKHITISPGTLPRTQPGAPAT
ncbi:MULTISPECIES: aldehyde dehydrogenase family protein [Streptomyces]|uniref:Aldehyde dehydrogenase n=1 Tax=Streptomyces dengpaensis TaxID=2049881 RepID=A0ABM6SNP5_9ACTN|nr:MULTISPECIES: aldehyde dehydrogenase family protein [Streptomyces]AVH56095.1 aldehyde dehydrogenase [Streptomyces dengpaensis]PIB06353.1 aldehyde dehydrogenase [Streptomyces sp. HG99]